MPLSFSCKLLVRPGIPTDVREVGVGRGFVQVRDESWKSHNHCFGCVSYGRRRFEGQLGDELLRHPPDAARFGQPSTLVGGWYFVA